jgi:hypothetical protein
VPCDLATGTGARRLVSRLSERIRAASDRIQKSAYSRSGDYNAALLVVAGELGALADEVEFDEAIEDERRDAESWAERMTGL